MVGTEQQVLFLSFLGWKTPHTKIYKFAMY